MNASELIRSMARLDKHRASLYLSTEKIEQWYLQKVSQITELGTGDVLSGRVEAGLFGVVRGEAGGGRSTESKVAVDNVVVQGVVAENVARASNSLIDLSSAEPRKGELLYYHGPARMTIMGMAVVQERSALSREECSTIEYVRGAQESVLRVFDPVAGTIVLTFSANGRAYASIASLKSVNANWLSSYWNEGRFGILCTLESQRDGVVFLDPLWIWHE